MANTLLLKRQSTASAAPTTGQLALGELAVNSRDGTLFLKRNDGTTDQIVKVWTETSGGNGSGLDADLLDGQHGSYYQQALVSGTNIKTINGVSVLGSGDVTISAAGGGITYTKKIANYTAVDKDGILADTSAGAFAVTLPSSPNVGMQVWIADGSSWALNSLTITPSTGTQIGDLAVNENLILDIAGIEIHLIYTGQKWLYYYSNFGANGSAITFEKQAQFSASGITAVSPIFTAPITTYRGGNFRLTIQNGSAHRYMNFNILHDGSVVQIYDDFFGGSLEIGSTNATITADINTGMLRVLAASSSGQISIKGVATLMVV